MVRVFRSNQFQGRKVQETTHFAAVGGAAAGALEGLEPSAQGLLGVSLPTPKALTMRAWSASRKKEPGVQLHLFRRVAITADCDEFGGVAGATVCMYWLGCPYNYNIGIRHT